MHYLQTHATQRFLKDIRSLRQKLFREMGGKLRKRFLQTTEQGEKVLRQAHKVMNKGLDAMLSVLEEKELEQFLTTLESLKNRVAKLRSSNGIIH